MINKFKNFQGVRYTRGLFYETTLEDKTTVVYTLKQEPHKGYPSLYQAYMSDEDPTEYTFATNFLDSWDHWLEIRKATWFQEYISKWETEKELRLKSLALARIMELAKAGGKETFSANRFLLEFGGKPKKAEVGRPTKEAIRHAAEEHFQATRQINEDFERLKEIN